VQTLAPAPRVAPIGLATCQPVGTGDPVVAIDTIVGENGCVPASTALLYRCDPSSDPVLVLDGATRPRVFLGGSFAVDAASTPPDARPLGVATLGRVFDDPRDPRSAYVVAGDQVDRWLAVPDASQLNEPIQAFLLGDSILEGAIFEVQGDLPAWEMTFDAVIGRSSSGGVGPMEALLGEPDVVVVELGVNDHDVGVFSANAERILTAAAGTDLVVWVTPHGPDSVTDEIDRAIPPLLAATSNGIVADWNAKVPLDALSSDGVHLDTGNTGLFADFLTPILHAWLAAVDGTGATRCGSDVLAASA
jgi:hypothetical protein